MSQNSCFLVALAEETTAEAARIHLLELRDRLGPGVRIDLRWRGDFPGEPPAGVRILGRGSGARALAASAARAAGSGHLIVLLGTVVPDSAAIQGILSAFDLDPLVGFAQPRFADATGDRIWSLPDRAPTGPMLLPRQLLSMLPKHYLTTERLSACIAVRREVVAGFANSPDSTADVLVALLEQMCQARRCGYRNLVMNRVVVVTSEGPAVLYPELGPSWRADLYDRFPDALTADEWFTGAIHQRFERVAANSRRPAARNLPVLLDCRGAQAHHNGTSQAILGLLDGLAAQAPRWDIDLLCNENAVEYHEIGCRYPSMSVTTAVPDRTYAVAVRLDQPWHLSTVAELHRQAAAIAFNVLDTIAWDVVYLGSPEVGKAWRFIAEHADGLLYNSSFTQQRFNFRFEVAPAVAQMVTHHSLDPAEHRDPAAARLPEGDHLLVFGNNYEHKAVASTIDLLSRAFPYRPFLGVGPQLEPRHNVTSIPSGRQPVAEIDRLVATARLVIFPSYYEGFGLPVVKALAYGRTVIVRTSPLWRELAGSTRTPGRLVEFTAPHELVEAVGKALAGEALDSLTCGAELVDAPPRWRDCAGRMVALVEQIAPGDARGWYARDQALGLAGL